MDVDDATGSNEPIATFCLVYKLLYDCCRPSANYDYGHFYRFTTTKISWMEKIRVVNLEALINMDDSQRRKLERN